MILSKTKSSVCKYYVIIKISYKISRYQDVPTAYVHICIQLYNIWSHVCSGLHGHVSKLRNPSRLNCLETTDLRFFSRENPVKFRASRLTDRIEVILYYGATLKNAATKFLRAEFDIGRQI